MSREKKRGRGRPSICGEGVSPVQRVRLAERHLAALDRLVDSGFARDRSAALRWLVDRAIEMAGATGPTSVTKRG